MGRNTVVTVQVTLRFIPYVTLTVSGTATTGLGTVLGERGKERGRGSEGRREREAGREEGEGREEEGGKRRG